MSITLCHCSGFILITSVSFVIPALFTSTSTVPNASTASLNIASISFGSAPECIVLEKYFVWNTTYSLL